MAQIASINPTATIGSSRSHHVGEVALKLEVLRLAVVIAVQLPTNTRLPTLLMIIHIRYSRKVERRIVSHFLTLSLSSNP
jgi:hypothetical protein